MCYMSQHTPRGCKELDGGSSACENAVQGQTDLHVKHEALQGQAQQWGQVLHAQLARGIHLGLAVGAEVLVGAG